jgi:ubiquinone/menaquinone biosynthesis C-methylase UbiE
MAKDVKGGGMSNALEKVANAYESPTWWYDIRGFFILKLGYRCSLFGQINFFSKNLNGQHLEVAVGTGTLTLMCQIWRFLRSGKYHVQGVGFDYSKDMLKGASWKLKSLTFDIIHADVNALPFAAGTFDTVNIANALHCFPDYNQALLELARVMKTDAKMYGNAILHADKASYLGRVAYSIGKWGMRKGILTRVFSEDEVLNAIPKAGLKVVDSYRTGNALNFIATKI